MAWEDERSYICEDIRNLQARVAVLEKMASRVLVLGTVAAFLGSAAAQIVISVLVHRITG